jgi:Fe-S cluster assembly ATPase SufC
VELLGLFGDGDLLIDSRDELELALLLPVTTSMMGPSGKGKSCVRTDVMGHKKRMVAIRV